MTHEMYQKDLHCTCGLYGWHWSSYWGWMTSSRPSNSFPQRWTIWSWLRSRYRYFLCFPLTRLIKSNRTAYIGLLFGMMNTGDCGGIGTCLFGCNFYMHLISVGLIAEYSVRRGFEASLPRSNRRGPLRKEWLLYWPWMPMALTLDYMEVTKYSWAKQIHGEAMICCARPITKRICQWELWIHHASCMNWVSSQGFFQSFWQLPGHAF